MVSHNNLYEIIRLALCPLSERSKSSLLYALKRVRMCRVSESHTQNLDIQMASLARGQVRSTHLSKAV